MKIFVIPLIIALSVLKFCGSQAKFEQNGETKKPNFKFETIEETLQVAGNYPSAHVYFYVEKDLFTKDNIIQLFTWYSSISAKKNERIKATACPDKDLLVKNIQVEEWARRYGYELVRAPAVVTKGWRPCQATFFRHVDEVAGKVSANESIIFCHNLDEPRNCENIYLN